MTQVSEEMVEAGCDIAEREHGLAIDPNIMADALQAALSAMPAGDEVAQIVGWLRKQAEIGNRHMALAKAKSDEKHQRPELWAAGVVAVRNAADAIERGEHRQAKEAGE